MIEPSIFDRSFVLPDWFSDYELLECNRILYIALSNQMTIPLPHFKADP